MAATVSTARPVAPAAASGVELRWEGSELHTNIVITDADTGAVVTRGGKGDTLTVDLFDARFGMTPVIFTDGTVVAHLGTDRNVDFVGVTFPGVDGWTEYPNIETALVDLAFAHIT